MQQALVWAEKAGQSNEVPIGAVFVYQGQVIAGAHNLTVTEHDPTAHAEMLVIREAAKIINNQRLIDSILYVSLEPCSMCAGAIVQARIPMVVYGAHDPRAGACGSVFKIIPNEKLNHRPVVIGNVLADASVQLLQSFFKKRR